MKHVALRLSIAGLLALLVVGGGALAWHLRPRTTTYFTDTGDLRVRAEEARVRSILWQPAAPLPGDVNTERHEYGPRVTADGTRMLFARGRAGHNADLFTATRTARGWTTPTALADVNTPADELGPAPAPSGDAIYFYSNRGGGHGGYDLWVVHRTADGWSAPENLGPEVNSPYNEYGVSLTPDGTLLYFASDRPTDETAGDDDGKTASALRRDDATRSYDLYRAVRTGGRHEDVEPVAALNTPHNEGAPFVSPQGDFLYFCSDRPQGEGGFDLYRVRRLESVFGPVTNLGVAVNTAANEIDPSVAAGGFHLHFGSDRSGGDGGYDILHALSREVVEHDETYRASLDLDTLTGLLAQVLLYLIVTLLIVLALVKLPARQRPLSLLARCTLGSLLVHMVVLLAFSIWKVSTSILGTADETGGTRVAIVSPSVGRELAGQVRGGLVEVQPTMAAQVTAPRQRTPLPSTVAESATAITVQRIAIDADTAPSVTHEAQDAAQEATPFTPREVAAPTRVAAIEIALPAQPQQVAVAEATAVNPTEAITDTPLVTTSAEAPTATPTTTSAVVATAVQAPEVPVERPSVAPATVAEAPTRPTRAEPAPLPATDDRSSLARLQLPSAPTTATAQTTSESAPDLAMAIEAVTSSRAAMMSAPTTIPAPLRTAPATPGTLPDADSFAPPTEQAIAAEPPALPTVPSTAVAVAAAETPVTLPDAPAPANSAVPPPTGVEPPVSATARASRAPVGVERPASPTNVDLSTPAVATLGPETALVDALPPSTVDPAPIAAFSVAGNVPGVPTEIMAAALGAETSLAPPVAITEIPDGDVLVVDLRRFDRLPVPAIDTLRPDPGGAETTIIPAAPPEPGLIERRTLVRVDPREEELRTIVEDVASPAIPFDQLVAARPIALQVNLPAPDAPPSMQYVQRSPAVKMRRLEEMGGSKETERSVMLALEWLARHQGEDGSWDGRNFDDHCGRCGDEGRVDSAIALTGLSLLAYFAADHSHVKPGPYREGLDRALSWLIAQQAADGSLVGSESMYSHGIATMALAEAYGMTGDARLREAVEAAANFVYEARNRSFGGWRYKPGQVGDTSVLGWQVMALTSAKRAGIEVADEGFDVARQWLPKVVDPAWPGLYGYQPARNATPSMTAEGMFVQQLLGAERDTVEMRNATRYLRRHPPEWGETTTYYLYYATLALFQHGGSDWDAWNQRLKRELVANQHNEGQRTGSWDANDQWATAGGRVYQTALCALTLEVYYRYLPLYVRDGALTQR